MPGYHPLFSRPPRPSIPLVCDSNSMIHRSAARQTRETLPDGLPGRLLQVNEHEELSLITRWIQQLTSALEYVEKTGFSHHDVHLRNCLLDKNLNLTLSDFDNATTIGQFLESAYTPSARMVPAGPLKGTDGLCGA